MKKIDFSANTEVKYLANWKVVQTALARHKVDKIVPIDRLVKCRMQDNLEFLQWCKKYWDTYSSNANYDATGRRGGQVPASTTSSVASSSLSNSVSAPIRVTTSSASSSTTTPRRATGTAASRSTSRTVPGTNSANASAAAAAAKASQSAVLQREVDALTETVAGLEKERDFYFNKLRDIEILIQGAVEEDPAAAEQEGGLVKQVQEVLYSTEEGFEVPVPVAEEGAAAITNQEMMLGEEEQQQDDDEVF